MNITITLNRAAGTVTVNGDMAELPAALKSCREKLLESASAYYAQYIECNTTESEHIDDAEKAIAFVAETIAAAPSEYISAIYNQTPEISTHTIANFVRSCVRNGKVAITHTGTDIPNVAAEARAKECRAPERPAIINGRWNGTIYGGARKGYSVYVDGEKIDLTDSQREEINKYLADKETCEAEAKAAASSTPYTVTTAEPEPAEKAEPEETEEAEPEEANDAFVPNPELDEIISEYNLKTYPGGKVGTDRCPKSKIPTLSKLIREHKAELLEYIPAKAAHEKAEAERREANFNAVAGVPELREARREYADYKRRFDRAWERGDGIIPTSDSGKRLEALEAEYPLAVFALKVEGERYAANCEIADIARRAYDRIREGGDVTAVKTDYDADKSAFAEKHLWD